MKKIGIFGGAFNPIHIGHLISANSILNQLNLDEILFIPCYIPVFKKTHTLADAKFRLQMIKLAISDNKKFRVSSIEIKRKGVSYTIDTLKELSKINN
ncbi:MAG: adenylyltransferase/cytidyltransferase family protein, partial [Ignavibacteria bacterium]|nr:adenylyltransferase/cytidyltransferase family protein [Ignavibacteria bacterium]